MVVVAAMRVKKNIREVGTKEWTEEKRKEKQGIRM